MKRSLSLLCYTILLAGCATGSKLTLEQQNAAKEPLLCSTKQDCDLMWQRAQAWVANNSHWRIQIATDTLIQTYGPGNDAYSAYTITKELNKENGARIRVTAKCGNQFGCVPAQIDSIYFFKQYLTQ